MPIYLHKELPSAYQEVEYIQSSGTQYIKPGISAAANDTLKFKADIYIMGNGCIYGQFTSAAPYVMFQTGIDNNNFFARINSNESGTLQTTWTPSTYTVNTRYNVVSEGTTSVACKEPYILAQNDQNGVTWYLTAKLYSFKIWLNGILVRNLVPCYRKSDNVIGMYDLVTNQFYTNSGTGTFTKGSNVSNSHTIECLSRLYKGSDLLVGGKCTPGHELLAYFPFKNDINDVMGNVNLATVLSGQSVTYSKSSIGYEFVVGYNDNDILIGNASNGMYNARTMSVRLQRISDSSGSYGGKVSSPMLFGANYCFRHWQTNPNNAREICDLSNCTFGQHEYLSKNTWYNIIITYNGTTFVCYLNGNNRCSANRGMYIDPNTGMCHSILRGGTLIYSELLYDKVMWDSNEATAYYNNTKSQYGL